MKYLKSVDFVGQSIVLLLLGGIMIASFFTSTGKITERIFFLLYAQLFLGPWQMLSAAIGLLLNFELRQERKIHFWSSLVCLLGIVLSFWMHETFSDGFTKGLTVAFLVIIPWGLALHYYSITWRSMFPKRYTGKFLSHINF